MKLASFFLFISHLIAVAGHAQSLKQLERFADQQLSEGNIVTAMHYYGEAVEKDSLNLPLVYKYATSLRLNQEYHRAAHYFAYVYKRDRGRVFPEALFWQATMEKYQGKYSAARKNFKRSLSKFRRDKKGYFFRKINQELVSTDFAMASQRSDSDGVVLRNVDEINGMQSEFGAIAWLDSILYFSSLRTSEHNQSTTILLYQAEKATTDTFWRNSAVLIIKGTDTTAQLANPTITPEGDRLYFSHCIDGKCEIWLAERKADEWIAQGKVNGPVNERGSNTQPSFARLDDGREYLFFVSDRNGADRKLDIFHGELINAKTCGTVSEPGDSINTIDDDITPFYDPLRKKLYFSSTWHKGFGGFDIFMAAGSPGQSFSVPYNLGKPFNSQANDLYLTVNPEGNTGYLSSNRPGSTALEGETCCNDLYYYSAPKDTTPPPLTVENSLKKLSRYLPLTLYFHNDEPDPRTLDTTTRKSYMETFTSYVAQKDLYSKEYSKGLSGEDAELAAIEIESFFEEQVASGARDLQEFTAILQEALEQGYEIELTIKGYASTLAMSDYNVNLTRRRISSLKNYINAYQDGALQPYIKGSADGRLTFREIPFGEVKASAEVSDNLNDLKNSVYSKRAALERKIEILAVSVSDSLQTHEDSTLIISETGKSALIFIPATKHNFGEVTYGQKVEHSFEITNLGKIPLSLTGSRTSCGCTVAQLPEEPLLPGETTSVRIIFDSAGKYGRVSNTVYITTDGEPALVELIIDAEVIMGR